MLEHLSEKLRSIIYDLNEMYNNEKLDMKHALKINNQLQELEQVIREILLNPTIDAEHVIWDALRDTAKLPNLHPSTVVSITRVTKNEFSYYALARLKEIFADYAELVRAEEVVKIDRRRKEEIKKLEENMSQEELRLKKEVERSNFVTIVYEKD